MHYKGVLCPYHEVSRAGSLHGNIGQTELETVSRDLLKLHQGSLLPNTIMKTFSKYVLMRIAAF